MTFNDKLNLLMRAQNISNSRLAKAISVDASLISRWRSGSRTPGGTSLHIKSIASYLSEQAKMDYQKASLFKIIGIPFDNEKCIESAVLIDLLISWFSNETNADNVRVDSFLDRLVMFGTVKALNPSNEIKSAYPSGQPLQSEVYYGISGKRESVLRFLSTVLELKRPTVLLLYSDEGMEWLTEDKAFYLKWGTLLGDVIAKGNKIKIIHTIDRDVSEMLAAIDRWLPLYMTGAIEPYYYPKYREYIFRRTMFIAPGIAALSSSTLYGHTDNAANIFTTDRTLIHSMVDEFQEFLSMCRPLMRIFTGIDSDKQVDLLKEYEAQAGDAIYMSNTLSSITMPEKLLHSILLENDMDPDGIQRMMALQKERIQNFNGYITENTYIEIVSLPTMDEVLSHNVPIELSGFVSSQNLYYTPSIYTHHIESIIGLLETNTNYHFLIRSQGIHPNVLLTAKDDVGALVAKRGTPSIVFAFNQQDMTYSFYSYLEDMMSRIPKIERNSKYIIKKLKEQLL